MNVGYFINRIWTPLEKINWTTLKSDGISEVYVRCAEENLEAISAYLPAIKAAGLKPYAWTWRGYTRYQDTVNKGWNICADIENNTNLNDVPEIKAIRAITKASGKTFILCTKAEGSWDGDQAWPTIVPLCDYIMPMLYLGDYNKTIAQLTSYMNIYNTKYPGKVYPALETYISDKNPTPKTNAQITAELKAVEPYCKGAGLFRYGLSNYKAIPEVPKVTLTTAQIKAVQHLLGLVEDGIYGPVTIAAVKKWQGEHGLIQDGIVGPITWAKMFPPVTVGPIQKQIQDGTGHTFTNFTQFYNIVKEHCVYAYYFNGQKSVPSEVSMLIADINGAANGMNCVDYTQIGIKLAKEMGYTATAYGIYCPVDKINHAIFLIKGKEFTASTWIDLAAAASSSYAIGRHWCSGALTKNPNWIPYE